MVQLNIDQGWLLVGSSALITFLGCLVICSDLIYQKLFPKKYNEHPFHIQNSTEFLISSLALSSGCLIFTSLYKLLPRSHSYLKNLPIFKQDKGLLNATQFSFYFSGIIGCSLLNLIVHVLTSESLVHCVHDDVGPHDNHGHDDNDDENDDVNELIKKYGHSHDLSHDHSHSHAHSHSHLDSTVSDDESDINLNMDHMEPAPFSGKHLTASNTSTKPSKSLGGDGSLLPMKRAPVREKTLSLMDLSLKALKGEQLQGDCYGDLDACADEIMTHSKKNEDNNNKLHFCARPTEENLLFIDQDHLITNKSEFNHKYPSAGINSPLFDNSNSNVSNGYGSVVDQNTALHCHHQHHQHHHDDADDDNELHDHEDHDHHQYHHEDHHHHIKTPLSRLLSIGIQTIIAITFHKFPEGFIMYATSKANPELGLMIFISMFIHNFVEGFTMTLPLYVALGSRWKAILISGTLGGLAQPIGALIGWITFKGNMDMDDNSTILLIGGLLSLTSGFLTYISLQMFASSISFGGKQEKVMKWAFIGVFLICLSDVLI